MTKSNGNRTAIYARFSSDLQRPESIEDQVRLCRDRIRQQGWAPGPVYSDYAASGSTALRPGYQTMIEAARLGEFDILIAEALDRLSRDQEHIAALFKMLRFAEVRLFTLAEGEISELHIGLKGTMNALYLRDLALKTHRGLDGRVRAGASAGGRAYGYSVVRQTDPRGEPLRGGRIVNEAEAAVVHRIFADFAAGKSPRAIASALNAEDIPGPDGGAWQDTTIRGHHARRTGILRNDLYSGRLVWNRMRFQKNPDTGKRTSRPNPEAEWIVQDVPHLRIIPPDLWDRVQTRLAAIRGSARSENVRAKEFWKHRRPKNLLSGKVFCGYCGGTLSAVGKDYLACSTARNRGTCANHRSIRRHVLEDLVLDALKARLMQPESVQQFIAVVAAETNRRRGEAEVERAGYERDLGAVRRKLANLIDAIADGVRAPDLQTRLDELQARQTELLRRMESCGGRQPRFHPSLAAVYRAKVADLQTLLAGDGATEAREALRALIERVVVHPLDGGGFEIELVGDIASMVELGLETQKAAPCGTALAPDWRRSVKVVAGAGFEPATFRL